MTFRNKIKKIYDSISKEYYQSESHSSGKTTIKNKYENFIIKSKPQSVLDLGCGSGTFAIIAKKVGIKQVVGVDISLSQIEIARAHTNELGINIDYILGDITELSLNKQFGGLVSSFGFCYAETEAILGKQLRTAKKHLRSGGYLFAVICDPTHPISSNPKNYKVSLESHSLHDSSRLKCEFLHDGKVVASDNKFYWTKETWLKLLNKAGFTEVSWEELATDSTNTILIAS